MIKTTRRSPWLPFTLALLIIFYRMPERLIDGYLWAEDATIFIHGAFTHGWSSLFEAYAGYAHVLPRLLTLAMIKAVPLEEIPYGMPWVCAVLWAAGTTYIFSVCRTAPFFEGKDYRPWALAISATPFLVPHSGEVFLSVTNLQWVMCPVLVVLVWDSFLNECRAEDELGYTLLRSLSLAILSLTGPFAVLLWPVAAMSIAWRWRMIRDWRIFIPFLCYTASVGFQLSIMLASRSAHPALQQLDWMNDFFGNVIAEQFIPVDVLKDIDQSLTIGCIIAALILVFTIQARARYVGLSLAALGVVLWASAMLRINDPNAHFSWIVVGTRYVYLPAVFMAWMLLLSAASTGSRLVRVGSIALLAMMALTSAGQFRAERGMAWSMTTANGKTQLTVPPGWKISISE